MYNIIGLVISIVVLLLIKSGFFSVKHNKNYLTMIFIQNMNFFKYSSKYSKKTNFDHKL